MNSDYIWFRLGESIWQLRNAWTEFQPYISQLFWKRKESHARNQEHAWIWHPLYLWPPPRSTLLLFHFTPNTTLLLCPFSESGMDPFSTLCYRDRWLFLTPKVSTTIRGVGNTDLPLWRPAAASLLTRCWGCRRPPLPMKSRELIENSLLNIILMSIKRYFFFFHFCYWHLIDEANYSGFFRKGKIFPVRGVKLGGINLNWFWLLRISWHVIQ